MLTITPDIESTKVSTTPPNPIGILTFSLFKLIGSKILRNKPLNIAKSGAKSEASPSLIDHHVSFNFGFSLKELIIYVIKQVYR